MNDLEISRRTGLERKGHPRLPNTSADFHEENPAHEPTAAHGGPPADKKRKARAAAPHGVKSIWLLRSVRACLAHLQRAGANNEIARQPESRHKTAGVLMDYALPSRKLNSDIYAVCSRDCAEFPT